MKTVLGILGCVLVFFSLSSAQEPSVVETKFPVSGACGMCKTRIEQSLKIKEVKFARWDKKSKVLTVAYVSPTMTVDSLQRRLAAVGHDSEKYKAPDEVYNELPACCHYRDGAGTH
jgi:hypothetical protein